MHRREANKTDLRRWIANNHKMLIDDDDDPFLTREERMSKIQTVRLLKAELSSRDPVALRIIRALCERIVGGK